MDARQLLAQAICGEQQRIVFSEQAAKPRRQPLSERPAALWIACRNRLRTYQRRVEFDRARARGRCAGEPCVGRERLPRGERGRHALVGVPSVPPKHGSFATEEIDERRHRESDCRSIVVRRHSRLESTVVPVDNDQVLHRRMTIACCLTAKARTWACCRPFQAHGMASFRTTRRWPWIRVSPKQTERLS